MIQNQAAAHQARRSGALQENIQNGRVLKEGEGGKKLLAQERKGLFLARWTSFAGRAGVSSCR